MKKLSTKTAILLLILINYNNLYADGTKTASPDSTKLTALTIMPSRNGGTYFNCPIDNRVYFDIKDFTNEKLYFGFDWRSYQSTGNNPSLTNIYMQIYSPMGAAIGLPIQLSDTGIGHIENYNQAAAGPNINGNNPSGYNPKNFTPNQNGMFWVEIYRSLDNGISQTPNTTWSYSPFFDLSVANNAGIISNGRVHCNKWTFTVIENVNFLTSSTTSSQMSAFCYTSDSNIIKMQLQDGFMPIAFDVSMNNYGTLSSGNWFADRKSINQTPLATFTNGYKLFLEMPDTSIYKIGEIPANPTFANPALLGCGPYTIRYNLPTNADVILVLDINGTPGFQPNTSDRKIELLDQIAGFKNYSWDGKDGLGNNVASTNTIGITVCLKKGRVNVPFTDAELNINGLKFSSVLPIPQSDLLLFWNDEMLTDIGATCGPSTNNITSAGINNSTLGQLSPAHAWNGDGNPNMLIPAPSVNNNDLDLLQCNDFGNSRIINTWTYATEKETTKHFNLKCINISGTVWDDANNSANGSFANIFSSGETGLNNSGMFVSLADPETGNVLQSIPVNANGTYTFTGVSSNTTNYQIILTNTQDSIGSLPLFPTIGNEYINTTPLQQNINTDSSNVLNVDFGINILPKATSYILPIQGNPYSKNYILSNINAIDIDGQIDSIFLLSMPSNCSSITINGVTYTPLTFPISGVTFAIQNGIPINTITIQPVLGNVDVELEYATIDNINNVSNNIGLITIPFRVINLSGNVFNDLNNNAIHNTNEDVINGSNIGAGILLGSTLFANIIDSNNNVAESQMVSSNGTFLFNDLPANTANFTLQISINQGIKAQPKPITSVLNDWYYTGQNINGVIDTNGTGEIKINTNTSDIFNQSFGIQQAPTSAISTVDLVDSGGMYNIIIPDSAFIKSTDSNLHPNTADPNGGAVVSVKIIDFPFDKSTININGITYDSTNLQSSISTPLINGSFVNPISINPNDTNTAPIDIHFVAVDNGGKSSNTEGSLALNISKVVISNLSLHLISFKGYPTSNTVELLWETQNETNQKVYMVQRSKDAKHFTNIGNINAKNKDQNSYAFSDKTPDTCNNIYRIKSVDINNRVEYSNLVLVKYNCNSTAPIVYPNPVKNVLQISNLLGGENIKLYSFDGKIIFDTTAQNNVNYINMATLASGIYQLIITNENGVVLQQKVSKE